MPCMDDYRPEREARAKQLRVVEAALCAVVREVGCEEMLRIAHYAGVDIMVLGNWWREHEERDVRRKRDEAERQTAQLKAWRQGM